ncbi:hypothetical protein CANARDRAFT_231049 [[Candida] arabinofermentans NRRL YB-2248]|uniref:diphosphoinositol-polyphosphate diphosphatase n=1 Tax=[Candida] arabinofermentans NRRL YB-2248 TaxID=983967 RepID=A0A1E4T5C4_9ASCO|nr:hypothetical protein CANARDRAFT_231049 [[Candida] arabinofermentans NRRL YB-2248]
MDENDEIFDFEQAYDEEFTNESHLLSDELIINHNDNYSNQVINKVMKNSLIPTKDTEPQQEQQHQEQQQQQEEEIVIDEDDEDQYDKFIPTDSEKIKKYKKDQEYLITVSKKPPTLLTPPENFSPVCGLIYRSSFPRIENFEFLLKLKLKSIICLIPEEYPPENIEFLNKNNINFYQIGLSGNKEPFVKIKPNLVNEALKILTNPENHPILIHCNRGKHRTGCIVGCIRKLQKWSLSMIFDEYRKFAYPKERPLDQQFIEMFDDSEIQNLAFENNWLPLKW